ncbi:MAG: hypothetical protein A2140_06290 [Candidatus Muproteobacteria bacterium RBG_16_62_13]|uniref:Uncharacterized protein n=1 Tax=Candidatus Muproteobacteria bacterium RBG_16_62_13 TaxID=1817756 RepID=A0A1F6SXI4_9PROT|nr:MAG: hypothetical protein A2140_06290 [Candidatus Muproteobacteria bacterium RBG_16_62_13]
MTTIQVQTGQYFKTLSSLRMLPRLVRFFFLQLMHTRELFQKWMPMGEHWREKLHFDLYSVILCQLYFRMDLSRPMAIQNFSLKCYWHIWITVYTGQVEETNSYPCSISITAMAHQ